MNPPPAEIGMRLADVDTPALLVDLDAFERNLETMAHGASAAGVRLRPHAKTHKCAVIARRQMAHGAVGVCCQKVSEAQALVQAGVADVLVSNQVVGRRKLERLAALAREARVGVCVDDAGNLADVGAAATAAGVAIDVLVEVDVGSGRCGVAPGEEAVALAKRVSATDGLRFAGLQAYHGRAQHIRDHAERDARSSRRSPRRAPPSTCSHGRAWSAGRSPARAPARGSTRPRAASTTSCRPAPTSSWTWTMRRTATRRVVRSPLSSMRCSYSRRCRAGRCASARCSTRD